MATEILLPQNVEAEAAVLGSLLIDPQAYLLVSDILTPEDFYREAHRLIFQAYADLLDAGEVGDLITVVDELARSGKLEAVGGPAYVSSLANQVPTSANIEHYAHIVERTATLRRLIHAAGQIAAIAYNEPDADTAVTQAQELVAGVSKRVARKSGLWYYEAIDAYTDEVDARMRATHDTATYTGIPLVDSHTEGFLPGELVYIAGRPASGKSALIGSWLHNMAEALEVQGGPGMVEWITLEMRAAQQAKRTLSSLARVDGRLMRAAFRLPDGSFATSAYDAMRRKADDERMRLAKRIHLYDQPTTMSKIHDLLARQVSEHSLKVAVIDYLGLVEPENARADTYQRMSDMSRQLKQIALELGITVFCLLQMNRQAETRQNKRPMLSDLRDSGGLEQDADYVFGIYRGRYYYPRFAAKDAESNGHFSELMELLVLKAREGVADNITLPLRFQGEYTRVSAWPDVWGWEQYATISDDLGSGK